MKLTSQAFQKGEISKRFTGEGSDISPALAWSDVPKGTREFVLICEDPDAPKQAGKEHPFVHWLIYNISPSVTALQEGLPTQERMVAPVKVDQGKNSFGKIGYGGPMPPEGHGIHHYHFLLYALDTELGVPPGVTKEQLVKAMSGHILGSDELVGTYERKATRESA